MFSGSEAEHLNVKIAREISKRFEKGEEKEKLEKNSKVTFIRINLDFPERDSDMDFSLSRFSQHIPIKSTALLALKKIDSFINK